MPQVEPFDGSTDPLDHLEGYKGLMMLQDASDIFFCLAFPTTLKKAARVWYSGLQPESIYFFKQHGC